MILNKIGFLVCGSKSVGGWDRSTQSYDDIEYDAVYTCIKNTILNIVKHEQRNNPSFNTSNIVIISGTAKGPDEIAMIYAAENSIPLFTFPAQWKLFGKGAGFKRNLEMLDCAEYVLGCYDGVSKGTAHTLDNAKKRSLKVKTVLFKQED